MNGHVCANRYRKAYKVLNELEPALYEYMTWLDMDDEDVEKIDGAISDLRASLHLGIKSAKDDSRNLMKLVVGELNVPLA